jgi:hypothetical protein
VEEAAQRINHHRQDRPVPLVVVRGMRPGGEPRFGLALGDYTLWCEQHYWTFCGFFDRGCHLEKAVNQVTLQMGQTPLSD